MSKKIPVCPYPYNWCNGDPIPPAARKLSGEKLDIRKRKPCKYLVNNRCTKPK